MHKLCKGHFILMLQNFTTKSKLSSFNNFHVLFSDVHGVGFSFLCLTKNLKKCENVYFVLTNEKSSRRIITHLLHKSSHLSSI
jgi:hypothetical protein